MAVQLMASAEIKPNAQFLWLAPSAVEFSEVFSALSSLLYGAKSNALLRIVPSTNPYSPRKLFMWLPFTLSQFRDTRTALATGTVITIKMGLDTTWPWRWLSTIPRSMAQVRTILARSISTAKSMVTTSNFRNSTTGNTRFTTTETCKGKTRCKATGDFSLESLFRPFIFQLCDRPSQLF